MQELKDKLLYVLDLTTEGQNYLPEDLSEPLLQICDEANKYGLGNVSHEFGADDKETFFKQVTPQIEYLFWLSQNVEDNTIFVRLMEFISHFQAEKAKFEADKRKTEESMLLHEYEISYYRRSQK